MANPLVKMEYYFHLRIWHEIVVRAKVKHQYSLETFPRTGPRPRQLSGMNLGLITLFLAVSQVYANPGKSLEFLPTLLPSAT